MIRYWRGYHQRNENQHYKFFGHQSPQIGNGCPKYFSHSDFFGALFGHERCHAKQAQATDKYGQEGKEACKLAGAFLVSKFFGIGGIGKLISEGLPGSYCLNTSSILLSASLVPICGFSLILVMP